MRKKEAIEEVRKFSIAIREVVAPRERKTHEHERRTVKAAAAKRRENLSVNVAAPHRRRCRRRQRLPSASASGGGGDVRNRRLQLPLEGRGTDGRVARRREDGAKRIGEEVAKAAAFLSLGIGAVGGREREGGEGRRIERGGMRERKREREREGTFGPRASDVRVRSGALHFMFAVTAAGSLFLASFYPVVLV